MYGVHSGIQDTPPHCVGGSSWVAPPRYCATGTSGDATKRAIETKHIQHLPEEGAAVAGAAASETQTNQEPSMISQNVRYKPTCVPLQPRGKPPPPSETKRKIGVKYGSARHGGASGPLCAALYTLRTSHGMRPRTTTVATPPPHPLVFVSRSSSRGNGGHDKRTGPIRQQRVDALLPPNPPDPLHRRSIGRGRSIRRLLRGWALPVLRCGSSWS